MWPINMWPIKGHSRSAILISLALISLVLLLLLIAWVAARGLDLDGEPGWAEAGLGVFLILTVAVLWHLFGLIQRHFRALERLRGSVVTLAGDGSAAPPRRKPGEPGEDGIEVERLYGAVADLAARYAEERAAPDRRLGAVLASITEAMLVITEQGQVSLVNYPAKALLDGERVRVGTSVFAALVREPVIAAVEQARRAGQPVSATLKSVDGVDLAARVASLGEHGGAVLSFIGEAGEHRAELEHDLGLHDRPPPAKSFTGATPLLDLPLVVLDTETTGLDVTHDRIVSIGAVRLHGAVIYRGSAFDQLVHPGVAIPPRSTAIHGITDAMVADARPFAEVFAELRPLLENVVLVGHNIPYDIAMLRRECRLAGLAWEPPATLDTLHLAAVLDPDLPDLNLETLAARFGVDVHGRHTALGDALVTAGIYLRMLPRLLDAGVKDFAAARAFCERAKHVAARQAEAGW